MGGLYLENLHSYQTNGIKALQLVSEVKDFAGGTKPVSRMGFCGVIYTKSALLNSSYIGLESKTHGIRVRDFDQRTSCTF